MRKNSLKLLGAAALPAVLAALAYSCYSPDFKPEGITSVRLDRTEIALKWRGQGDGDAHVFTATLRPNIAEATARWFVSSSANPGDPSAALLLLGYDSGFDRNGQSTATVKASGTGSALVTVVATDARGHSAAASCAVRVTEGVPACGCIPIPSSFVGRWAGDAPSLGAVTLTTTAFGTFAIMRASSYLDSGTFAMTSNAAATLRSHFFDGAVIGTAASADAGASASIALVPPSEFQGAFTLNALRRCHDSNPIPPGFAGHWTGHMPVFGNVSLSTTADGIWAIWGVLPSGERWGDSGGFAMTSGAAAELRSNELNDAIIGAATGVGAGASLSLSVTLVQPSAVTGTFAFAASSYRGCGGIPVPSGLARGWHWAGYLPGLGPWEVVLSTSAIGTWGFEVGGSHWDSGIFTMTSSATAILRSHDLGGAVIGEADILGSGSSLRVRLVAPSIIRETLEFTAMRYCGCGDAACFSASGCNLFCVQWDCSSGNCFC